MEYNKIKNYDNYIIFKTGKVYSIKRGIFLKPGNISGGYLAVSLCKNIKVKMFTIHRLLGKCFLDNPNNYPVIDHINCNKMDNRLSNLRWTTYSINNHNSINSNKNKKNISGEPNISHRKERNSWQVIIYFNKKIYRKSFNIKKYTNEKAFNMAIQYRDNLRKELNIEHTTWID